MKQNSRINSKSYWNSRFSDNWQEREGPRQSRFFARLAVDNLPLWLIEQIRRQSLTLADWGCAQGDGTDILASHLNSQQLVGIDFSAVAIEQATKRYPAIRFVCENWLEAGVDACDFYDVVFSSNTLEHFHKPYEVVESLGARAKKAVVLALPYRELERIDEHFYSFLPDNIPLALNNGFRLIWSRVIDCRHLSNTHWGGDQIFLVYAENSWVDSVKLHLHDCEIGQDYTASEIASIKQLLAERDRQIADLNTLFDKETSKLRNQLINTTNLVSNINKYPARYALKKTALGIARSTLRSLPLSIATKQRLCNSFFSTINSLRRCKLIKSSSTNNCALPIALKPSASLERDVFVFAIIDWHFRIQRPQHIARSLANRGHRVFYFSNHFVDADEPGYQLEQLHSTDALYQVKLHVRGTPTIYFDSPSDQDLEMLTRSIAKAIEDFNSLSSFSIVQHAYWYPIVKKLPNSYRIYDCMDHHEGFGSISAKLVELEKEMLSSADLVTVTSSWLENFACKLNPNVALVRNAAEYAHFAVKPEQIYTDNKGRRIIGYYGAIAEWFDLDLVRAIALEHLDFLILLVGNDTIGAQKILTDLPNVKFIGEVPYTTLPFYLHAFDICILPFKILPITLATNPVKVYEYLAAGKPVICVDLPEISQFGNLVSRACSIEDFVVNVKILLQESSVAKERKSAERRRFASEQTWHHRSEELAKALKSIKMPRISIIILTFNNLDLTRTCLDSVLQHSDYPDLEIIVVDNSSSDDTPAYLENLALHHSNIRVVLNSENLGFAAGNNIGLSLATGDYLVILNNDTVVTQGWVMTLLRHFQHDPSIGITGPVTNNIGNEARISIQYQNIEEMPAKALRFTLANMGKTYPMRTIAFFCVMFPRSVYELCGPICEDYGKGFFEDDDYCRRVELTGKYIVCADDVFVHHHLSASFNKLEASERKKLFLENKEKYLKKWGTWIPHSYRNS